jgi:hypothetical protein
MNSEKYIGLDVHQATIVVAVTDSSGKLIMESILETEAATILQFFAGLRLTHVDPDSVTRSLRSTRITPSHRYYGAVRPCSAHRYCRPRGASA